MNLITALGTLLIGFFVYRFFKTLISGEDQHAKMEEAVKRHRMRNQERAATKAQQAQPEAMMQCAVCEAYLPESSASNCGRSDCPL